MRLMLLGAPGAGKGTQANILCEHFAIPQISTGDMLRAAIANNSPLGKKAKAVMEKGELVSDDIIIDIVKERLKETDCKNGYLLDGFPRTLSQAYAMREAGIKLDHVIEIYVKEDEIINRITGRRVHPNSGRVYHLEYCPPKKAGVDDISGEPLIQRDDDKEETVKKRLQVYYQQTAPLMEYYQGLAASNDENAPQYHKVDGSSEVNEVANNIIKKITLGG